MSRLNIYDSKTESQPGESCSNDFQGENTRVIQVEPHLNAFENIYTLPTFGDTSNYNMYFPSNTWASEAPGEFDSQLTGEVYSPPIPTHCISTSFITSSDNIDLTSPNGWQLDASQFIQGSSDMPWWCNPWADSVKDYPTIVSERTLKDGNSNLHKHNPASTSVSEATTDSSQHRNREGTLYLSPPRKQELDSVGSCRNTSIKRNTSALTVALRYSSEPATRPMQHTPAMSFDPPGIEAQTNPRRPRNSRRASPSSEKRRMRQSPTAAASPSEQRNRNRIAANKCRIKTKAAIAELEATEREESSKHEQLSMTLRGLQADVFALKSQILLHGICGDKLIQDYLNTSARSLTAGCGPGDSSHIPSPGSVQF